MSRRHQLQHRRRQLAEARQIISAMQSLAFIEVRRLRRFLDIQRQVTAGIYSAAEDLLGFHPQILPETQPLRPLLLVIGSERGFCGDFNEKLLARLQQCLAEPVGEGAGIVACGRKLCSKLERHPQLLTALDGAAVLDEIDGTLGRLAAALAALESGERTLTVIYHDRESEGVATRQLLPPFESLRGARQKFAFPPQLNLPPQQLLPELAEQYLFAALHEILYVSLMAENQRRMQHLEGAVRHLDNRLENIGQRESQLRQEEIIEEIEVILLNVESAAPPPT